MVTTKRASRRAAVLALSALPAAAISAWVSASPAVAKPETPVPACAQVKDLVVDVTQDVLHQPVLPARDGHLWADFSYTQHVRIWSVGAPGARQYCVRKDLEGSWVSIAGPSAGLTGTISGGLTGTFTDTTYWEWTGTFAPTAPTSGYLGVVHADCTAVDACADDSFLVVDNYYFPGTTQHCNSVRRDLEIDGGEHGHISLTIDGGLNKVAVTGDITG